MPDLSTAIETIDMYVEKYIVKPNASMTRTQFRVASQRLDAIDILKEYITMHWFEAPPADLIFNFVKEYKRRKKVLNDPFMLIVYRIAKDIFYYFI